MVSQANQLDQVFKAIGHPTRRKILRSISTQDQTVLQIAAKHPMSLNGISKHLKTLEAAGLIQREISGTTHLIRLRAAPLKRAMSWLSYYERFWEQSLLELKRTIENE